MGAELWPALDLLCPLQTGHLAQSPPCFIHLYPWGITWGGRGVCQCLLLVSSEFTFYCGKGHSESLIVESTLITGTFF